MESKSSIQESLIESEKLVDRNLVNGVKKLGGVAIKLVSLHIIGLPDRLCLLPGGRLFFAEIKTTGKKPRKIQLVIHEQLRKLGFTVEVIDTTKQVKQILDAYKR